MTPPAAPLGKTVLLVEDDSWLRFVMAELLVDDGYDVIVAATGTEALDQVERQPPDVVVLDLNIPGKSGLEVLHELRTNERTVALPVIVLSGWIDAETRQRLSRLPERADDVMEKPVDVELLFARVEQAIVG
jgi:DNA-binding response OmpR family regulator